MAAATQLVGCDTGDGEASNEEANDSDDEGLFDLSRPPPSLDDFDRFRLTGRTTGEQVQQMFEKPVTLLLMDHSRHYCSVFLTDYRLAFMFWADVDEPAKAAEAGGIGSDDAGDDPFRAAVDNVRIVSLPVIAIRELDSSSLSMGDRQCFSRLVGVRYGRPECMDCLKKTRSPWPW